MSLKRALGVPNLVKIFFQRNFITIGWGGNGFHPLRNIVNSEEDVEIIMGKRKGPHEVNPPYVKQLDLKNTILRHLGVAWRGFLFFDIYHKT